MSYFAYLSHNEKGMLQMVDKEQTKCGLRKVNDRYYILFDGEIYNESELISFLNEQGYSIFSPSLDTILTNLYDCLQTKCVNKLRGGFAFIIWDEEKQTLFAARDPFGSKPLYYKQTEERFLIASDKNKLVSPSSVTPLCQEAIQHYFSFQFVPEPYSFFDNIHTLRPGHYLQKVAHKSVTIHPYFELSFQPQKKELSTYTHSLRNVLKDAVRSQINPEEAVGIFLSGGLDSTSLVALAKEVHPNVKTFTVGFELEGFNEIDLAVETAELLCVENFQKVITVEEFKREIVNIVQHFDEPIADPAAVPLYFAAREASKYVQTVLSGEGADELFAGYNIYREPFALSPFNYIPESIKKKLNLFATYLPEYMKGKNYLIRGTTPLEKRYIGNANIFNEEEKQSLLTNYDHRFPTTNVTEPLFEKAANYDAPMQMQYIDLHTWLHGNVIAVASRMTEAHALRLRLPFLDTRVFHLASQLPTEVKLTQRTTKYVLRAAMANDLPAEAITRKKLGLPVPIRHWLKNELYDWARNIIMESPTDHIINKQVALDLLDSHSLKQDQSRKIWTILVFMIWYKQKITG